MVKRLAILCLVVGLILSSIALTVNAANPNIYTTTTDATYIPVAPTDTSNPPKPNEVADYAKKGYGVSNVGKGLGYIVRNDLLKPGLTAKLDNNKELLRFFTMSDIHITDIQSPAQVLVFGKDSKGMEAAYSAAIMYSTQVLDAAVKKVNKINIANKLDFGLMLGDAINNAQQNELNMYLDVLSGRMVYPNSDMSKKSDTDFSQPFKAEGLNMPWYQVIGNHDHFWSGVFNANDKLKKALISDKVMKIGVVPNSKILVGEDVYPGIIDVSDPYGKIIGDGREFQETDNITANTTRNFLDSKAFSDVFPRGHGINESSGGNPTACYTFEPKANVPVRVIVLDNTAGQDTKFVDATKAGDKYSTAAFGSLDKDRFAWFSKQLADADKARKLVVVAVHIPLGVGLWDFTSEVSEKQVIAELQKYSNIALLTAGHRHVNAVTAFKSPISAKPELGFWQVETASLRDFPQQFRIFDISLNVDNTIAIKATNVDTGDTTFASKSRSYAIAAKQIFPEMSAPDFPKDASGAYNAILLKKISSGMADILKKVK